MIFHPYIKASVTKNKTTDKKQVYLDSDVFIHPVLSSSWSITAI